MVNSLRLEFFPESGEGHISDGWGQATLYWNGDPCWHAGIRDDGTPCPVEWTWVDVLQWLAKNWIYLVCEQTLPLSWMNERNIHLSKVWGAAEENWQEVAEDRVDEEEKILIDYLDRHNLAAAMQGIYLPAVFWRRIGNEVALYREDGASIRVPFEPLRQHFETLGNQMAHVWRDSENPRVRLAMQRWQQRNSLSLERAVAISVGVGPGVISQIQGSQGTGAFWGADSVTDLVNGYDTPMLAAARMSNGKLNPETIARVIEQVRIAPVRQTLALDDLAAQLRVVSEGWQEQKPFEQGYRVARWLRDRLDLLDHARVDPQKLLTKWGVDISRMNLDGADIDAIACWGMCGPMVLLNDKPAWRAQGARKRATLAHEICHLLFDRHSALPVAEVLGGAVDVAAEQRARAFAAEFLLPRSVAQAAIRQADEFEVALDGLVRKFGVSHQIVTNQIENSGIPLAPTERQRLKAWNLQHRR